MSMSDVSLAAGSDTSLIVRYDLTSEEMFQVASARIKASRSRWLSRLAGVGALCVAVQPAMIGEWKIAALFGMAGFTALTGYRASDRLLELLFRGVVHVELMLDQQGMRGTLDPQMRFKKWSESSQFNYSWNQLRKAERLPKYLVLEFGGRGVFVPPGASIIPVAAFANAEDLQQCEAWAEAGLAQQRKKSA
jgi:hypothetical protein